MFASSVPEEHSKGRNSHTQQHDDPGGFNFPGGPHWMTSGSANSGDDDLIEVTFDQVNQLHIKLHPVQVMIQIMMGFQILMPTILQLVFTM